MDKEQTKQSITDLVIEKLTTNFGMDIKFNTAECIRDEDDSCIDSCEHRFGCLKAYKLISTLDNLDELLDLVNLKHAIADFVGTKLDRTKEEDYIRIVKMCMIVMRYLIDCETIEQLKDESPDVSGYDMDSIPLTFEMLMDNMDPIDVLNLVLDKEVLAG